MYRWDFGILWSYRWLLLDGLGVTIAFTAAIVVLGLMAGLIAAMGRLSRFPSSGCWLWRSSNCSDARRSWFN
jgi:ABC-type amino acid transport system permease subunit